MQDHPTPPGLVALEDAFSRLDALPPEHRGVADDAMAALLRMYGDGLARLVQAIVDAGPAAAELRRLLVEDPAVASLLLVHNLYPVPLAERVEQALSRTRGYVESHGGRIELVALDDGVARIRLSGTCKTCPASSATINGLLKDALEAEAPDLRDVVVEGVL